MSTNSHSSRESFLARRLRASARAVLIAVTVTAVIGSGFAAGSAFAQANQYSFSDRNAKKVQKFIELLQAPGTEAEVAANRVVAIEILESINLKRAKPYGRARIHHFFGTLAAQDAGDDGLSDKERNARYEKALEHFKAALEEEALQPDVALSTLYQIGQVQTILEQYDDAVATLEKWISQVENPSPINYYTLAATYFQAKRLDDAMAPAKKAIELSTDVPREAWYRLLLSLYLEQNQYQEALGILDDIIINYPKKAYWSQMAAIYSQLDQQNQSLAVQLLAKNEGFITEDRDITRVAQMFMVEGLPHRGAAIMKEGLENGVIEPTKRAYQTYSDTLLQSREWEEALEPLSKAAAMHDDGSLYMRLAQVNIQLLRWSDAQKAISRAFEKGDLSDEGQAHLLFGIAAANDRKWETAMAAFDRAEKFEGTAVTAGKWKQHVAREKARFGDS